MKRSPATLVCLFSCLMIGYQMEVTMGEKSSKSSSDSKKSEDYHKSAMEMSTKPVMKSRYSSKGKDIFVHDPSRSKGKSTKSSSSSSYSSSMSSSRSHYSAMMSSGKGGKGGKGISGSVKSAKSKGSKSAKASRPPLVSPQPTFSPTFANETLPPGATRTPTTSPTEPPTLSPTRGPFPCEPDADGLYGSTDGTEELIEFGYALETIAGTTDAQVDQIISDLEPDIARSVVERLVPECADGNRRLSEYQPTQMESVQVVMLSNMDYEKSHHRKLQEDILIGLSPEPDDVRLTDRTCDRAPNRCDLVRAAITIWTVQERRRLQGADDVLDAIQDSLAEDDFNSGRPGEPVIVGTDYVPVDDLEPEDDDDIQRSLPPSDDDDDDGLDTIWIIIIAVGGGVVLLLTITAFFLLRSNSVDNEDTRQLPKQGDGGSESSKSGQRSY